MYVSHSWTVERQNGNIHFCFITYECHNHTKATYACLSLCILSNLFVPIILFATWIYLRGKKKLQKGSYIFIVSIDWMEPPWHIETKLLPFCKWNTLYCMTFFVLWCKFNWSLFPRVWLAMSQHWFRQWHGTDPYVPPSLRPSIPPSLRWGFWENAWKKWTKMWHADVSWPPPETIQFWTVLAQFRPSGSQNTWSNWGFMAFKGKCKEGMVWNVECWCILTTSRNCSILVQFWPSGRQKNSMKSRFPAF